MTRGESQGCRWCRSTQGEIVCDLGAVPSCDSFPAPEQPRPDPAFPLQLWLCASCGLAQLHEDGPTAEESRGIEPAAAISQAREAVRLSAAAGLLQGKTFAEFDSPHGGSWHQMIAEHGLRFVSADGDERADVVLDVMGFMHEPDQRAAVAARAARLNETGTMLVQFHALDAILRHRQWNAIRHGHYAYHSVEVMSRMLAEHGLVVFDAYHFPIYGGTYLLAARRDAVPNEHVLRARRQEYSSGALDAAALKELGTAGSQTRRELRNYLLEAAAAGRRVFGYGAASRAIPLLVASGIDVDLLPAVADASRAKWGRALAGSRIPVISPAELVAARPDVVLQLVPDIAEEVRVSLPQIEESGGRWVVVEPRLRSLAPHPVTTP